MAARGCLSVDPQALRGSLGTPIALLGSLFLPTQIPPAVNSSHVYVQVVDVVDRNVLSAADSSFRS